MKDIKDYLHLYLGCDVACYSDHLRPEMKFERNATLDGIVNDSSRNEHPVKVSFHNEGFKYRSHYCYKFNEVKPLLRPLSDMTEEEKEKSSYRDINEMCQPWEFQYLLSKGFDLFGLIEAGLAIDKTTLKQN